jgi:RNA polymerase primary sigma factor
MIAVDVQDEFIALDPLDLLLSKDTDGLVEKLLKTLTAEDETLLRLRYGIGMVNEMTLEEIGDLRGITRERVRQIEVALIRKLKHPQVLDSILYGSKAKMGEGATQESIVNKNKVESVVREKLVNTAKVVQAVLPETNLNDQPRIFKLPTFSELKTPLNNSIPEPVKRLLEEAAELGAQIKSKSTTSDDSVWIDFTKAHTSPSRAFYRKMIASGFTIWGGRWSWR